MADFLFADVAHESISFSDTSASQALILKLIDTPWMQRLRDIHQTANTRLVYMFSEHSRFGHCLGVAYLADLLMEKLARSNSKKIAEYRKAVAAAALLHDLGHLAPGSHTAFKCWFPNAKDSHEEIGCKVIRDDKTISKILETAETGLTETICKILQESPDIPAWTWQIISGGGWNVDRGNWCIVDSILSGVSYGRYNVAALIESITITDNNELALMENRLDAMMHFSVSRHAMYRQVYQHRVLLAADSLMRAIVQRARDILPNLEFADDSMKEVLQSQSPEVLQLNTIFQMRESWWRYHITRWANSSDKILSDLCTRLLNRKLFKTVRIQGEGEKILTGKIQDFLSSAGLDQKYYLHKVSTADIHAKETKPMLVQLENSSVSQLSDCDPLFAALGKTDIKSWFAVPAEIKNKIGKVR